MSDQTVDLENLRNLARSYLKSNHIDRALQTYGQILDIYPEDLDAWLILGDAFLVSGDHLTAYAIYEQARQYTANFDEINKRISVLQIDSGLKNSALTMKLYPVEELVEDLIQRLSGNYREIPESDIIKARKLMEQVLKDDAPAEAVAKNFAEIDQLLPALIEINLRQAKSEGKTEVVRALKKVQQQVFATEKGDHQGSQGKSKKTARKTKTDLHILLTGESYSESPERFSQLSNALKNVGYDVFWAGELDGWMDWSSYDLVIVQNPHSHEKVIRNIAGFYSTGKPVLVDLQADFELMPSDHQEEGLFGLLHSEKKKAYYAALHLAEHLVVNNAEFASNLMKSGFEASYIPDSWDGSNPLWHKTNNPRSTFNLGLVCQPEQEGDVAGIRRSIIRVLREFPHTRLVVSGNLSAYRLFDQVSDSRKLFLPPVSDEEHPYIYSHMDVMLLPLNDTYFNHLRSDRRLMEAGVKKLPWIATGLRFTESWGAGGLQVNSGDEWYTHLHDIVIDENLRNRLGEEGLAKAQERKSEKIAQYWQQLFSEVLARKTAHKGAPPSGGW